MTKLAPALAPGQSSLEDDTVSLVHTTRPRTSSIDKAKKVASQLKNVVLAGSGFLADAYDLFVINIALDIMAEVDYKQEATNEIKSLVKSTAIAGAIIGQLFFGFLADEIGRKTIFIVTGASIIVGAALSATIVDSSVVGIYTQLIIYRLLLGFGVGGEYPLSATITAESSDNSGRGRKLASVFAMQGVGTFLCALVLVTVTRTIPDKDLQWRVALAFGALPMIATFYYRWIMHETSAWERVDTGALDWNAKITAMKNSLYEHRWRLLGTAGSWFILDVVFYANGLFSGEVTAIMGMADSPRDESTQALIIQGLALPGYFFTVAFVERIGRKRLQNFGFIATAAIFAFMSIAHPIIKHVGALYVIMYGLTFFSQNFGPNATTYIIPSEVFPTEARATCHGISAAAGKLGALLGGLVFLPLAHSFCPSSNCDSDDATDQQSAHGLQMVFGVCAIVSLLGAAWTMAFVDDVPHKSLKEAGASHSPYTVMSDEPHLDSPLALADNF